MEFVITDILGKFLEVLIAAVDISDKNDIEFLNLYV